MMANFLDDKANFQLISLKENWNFKISLKMLPRDNATNVIPNDVTFFTRSIT